MKWSLHLGKISGIKISIHWTFLILIIWIVQYHFFRGHNGLQTFYALAFLFAVFFCITLHELGHALAAKRYKFKTLGIVLLPIGGLARMENLPEKPVQELVVALMGPLVNVVIALLLFLVMNITDVFHPGLSAAGISGSNFWIQLYNVNLLLAIFNLIPAFPMDGGRVFRALLSFKLSRIKATRIASYTGQLIAILFVFFGFTFSPMLIFIGFFIFLGAQAELNAAEARSSLSGLRASDVVIRRYSSLKPDDTLSKAVSILLDSQEKFFLVKESGTVKGTLTLTDIVSGLAKYGPEVTLDEVMNKEVKSFSSDAKLQDILLSISAMGDEKVFPIYSDGELLGIINLENIREYLMVKDALIKRPHHSESPDLNLEGS